MYWIYLLHFVAAFTADSETSLQVTLGGVVIVESWTGEKGSTDLQEIPGLAGYSADEMVLVAIMSEGDYMGITEVRRLCGVLVPSHYCRFLCFPNRIHIYFGANLDLHVQQCIVCCRSYVSVATSK